MSNPIQPHTDATAVVGQIHKQQFNRDACHFAVYQITVANPWDLTEPPFYIGFKQGEFVVVDSKEKSLGILDPFLNEPYSLNTEDLVWLFLHPGMIQSLSHYWEHPAFPPAPVEQPMVDFVKTVTLEKTKEFTEEKRKAYIFLSKIADDLEISLDKLLHEAEARIEYSGHYYVGNAEAEGYCLSSDFWKNYNIYTGNNVSNLGNFISCSC